MKGKRRMAVNFFAFHFSHRDRFLSKLQSVALRGGSGDLPRPLPSAAPATEGQALVTFCPQSRWERPEDEHEEQHLNENNNTAHFNNVSYFFLQQ